MCIGFELTCVDAYACERALFHLRVGEYFHAAK